MKTPSTILEGLEEDFPVPAVAGVGHVGVLEVGAELEIEELGLELPGSRLVEPVGSLDIELPHRFEGLGSRTEARSDTGLPNVFAQHEPDSRG